MHGAHQIMQLRSALFVWVCLVLTSAKTMLVARQRNIYVKTLITAAVISTMLNYKSSWCHIYKRTRASWISLLLAFLFAKCVCVRQECRGMWVLQHLSMVLSWCSCAYLFLKRPHIWSGSSSLFSLCLLLGSLWALGSLLKNSPTFTSHVSHKA